MVDQADVRRWNATDAVPVAREARRMTKSLDNPINWSFPVGTLFRIRIRLHILFVFGAMVLLFQDYQAGAGLRGLLYGLGSVGMLFFIVLTHEFGHCFGARYSGGSADEILLWPLGGLAYTNPPHTPKAHLITVVAGPLVNVIYLILTGGVLITLGGAGLVPWNPFKPFSPAVYPATELEFWLVVFFALNYIILLFNLLPVFPLDGGRILQSVLWFRRGFVPATLLATGVGMVGAIAIGLVGLVGSIVMLLAIAFFGYFTCWQQRQMIKAGAYDMENEFGYDFSQGYTSLARSDAKARKRPTLMQRWRANRAAKLAKREADRLEERRLRIDAVLDKVHRDGVQSLTPKEKRLLEEETHRHRSS
jgi:Zn-dependent protease